MTDILKGKKAIVTGATAGIGKVIALNLAKLGALVAVVGTSEPRGLEVVSSIDEACGEKRAHFFKVDVSNFSACQETIKEILNLFGNVDILVNNAGITRDQLLMKMTEEDWDMVLDVNLKSCYNFCHALVRPMMKARSGKIINISSVVGLSGNAGQVNYAASKAGMIGLTKALAKELSVRNITVNCIAPGFIETPMTDVLSEDQKKAILGEIPLGKMGKPEDIANAVSFIASPLADYITGQVIVVDGGMEI